MKPVMEAFGTVFGNFTSLPVPHRFIVFRHNGEDGTALKVTYTVLGERTIGDKHYLLLNVTIPVGTWQIVASNGADSEKPILRIAYTSPSRPRPGRPFKLYLSATDNIGIRDMYAVVYDKATRKEVSYGNVSKFPAEPTSGKEDNKYYVFQFPALNQSDYEIKVIAVDFYNNTAEATKEINFAPATTTTSSSSSSTTSSSSSTTQTTTTTTSSTGPSSTPQSSTTPSSSSRKGTSICGPAAIVGLAIIPLLLRKKK
ncbi:CGP-CTERM sorting domain-containing protein [Thermococcus sp. Bubb.Bath]|uniref:CGP-CTERM sorting domain-containing protein n=1 Tax=Thermococcus sp. Bubb.Bath TaxID=1638242 RepID=UPI001F0FD250|nr:CGP-CTERM sorting domain-containing protein [Thermococcus sp. Bubb.Bath]